MNAALTAQLGWASKEAQKVLGETFTLAGTSYTGVCEEDPNLLVPTPNGLEPQRGLTIVATKSQFASAPSAATRPVVVARSVTWRLTAVKVGPLQYTLTCVVA